eukprot:1158858-Pelagomonas_calceolata.AAC.3
MREGDNAVFAGLWRGAGVTMPEWDVAWCMSHNALFAGLCHGAGVTMQCLQGYDVEQGSQCRIAVGWSMSHNAVFAGL